MTDQFQEDFNKLATKLDKQRQFVVKGNKVLASARSRLWHVARIKLKDEIHAMLKDGLHGTCNNIEVEQLRLWCGMPPLNKKKTPAKKAVMKKGADSNTKPPAKKKASRKAPAKKTGSGAGKPTPKADNIQKRGRADKPKNGGAGRGQGRKKGACTTKTRAIAERVIAEDEQSPLEYMMEVLRTTPDKLKAQYDAGEMDTVQYTVALQDLTRRRDAAAKDAASYVHPRLSSIEANVGLKGQDLFVALLEKEDS